MAQSYHSSCGETDIMAAFEAVVGGSNPSGSTMFGEHCAGITSLCYIQKVRKSGYCLVVGRVLAKDEAGVRFPLSAQNLKDSKGVESINVEKKGAVGFLWIILWKCALRTRP